MALILQEFSKGMRDKLLKNLKFFQRETEGAHLFAFFILLAALPSAALANGGSDDADFHKAKLVTARFYAERILPQAGAERRKRDTERVQRALDAAVDESGKVEFALGQQA